MARLGDASDMCATASLAGIPTYVVSLASGHLSVPVASFGRSCHALTLRGGGTRGLVDPGPADPHHDDIEVPPSSDEVGSGDEGLEHLVRNGICDDREKFESGERKVADEMRLRAKLPGYDSEVCRHNFPASPVQRQ